MKHISVIIICENNEQHKMVLPSSMVGELAEKLREEGPTYVHTKERSLCSKGMFVPAKGTRITGIFMDILNAEEE